MLSSQPEHAEACLRNGRVQRRGDREAEDVAGLDRIDDPVVPQARRGEIGVALVLVFLADRGLESLLLLRRPLVGVAVDGGQDACGLFPAHH
jgi:hypothetical protein